MDPDALRQLHGIHCVEASNLFGRFFGGLVVAGLLSRDLV